MMTVQISPLATRFTAQVSPEHLMQVGISPEYPVLQQLLPGGEKLRYSERLRAYGSLGIHVKLVHSPAEMRINGNRDNALSFE